ncbi:thiol-disulfide isomerase [Burkholderia cenocepacia]|uniref:thiol-disulfide isomerase n=1 Tax=Burkholderia cenocepacia TaxID=95486 RepID=UPI0023BA1623|nr:thiol-disulfide isomerase [Burkholderia cenocepacia]MDF0506647.1 thiol-disulfide isomerase [Burkholderia cenocepacia]
MTNTRRQGALLLLAGALWVAGIGTAGAQVPAGMEQLKPYLQVKPVEGDEETIRVFFSPSCQFSRNYFQFFNNLQATVPRQKTFVFTPLVNKADGIQFALSFLAVQKYYPNYLRNFMEAAYIGVQDRGISTSNWAGIDRIGQAAHLPVSVPRLVADHAFDLEKELRAALVRQKLLAVTNTPAVSVAGTYVVTPEFTSGDAALFSQLVNGLISMAR